MAETGRKKLLTLNISEIEAPDGGVDHSVEVHGSWSGLDVRFNTTIDKVREFFTEKRKTPPGVVVKQ